jgi:zinc/manganese transport system substrate-binding protein
MKPLSGLLKLSVLPCLFAVAIHQPVQASQPVVVAIDGTLCDLTRTLAGSAASVTCLIPPGGDPHSYRLKPSDRKALNKAALVLHSGFGLTPAAKKIKSPGTVVAVGEVAMPNYKGNDPHVWHDPANSAAMVTVVAENLEAVVPADQKAAIAARAVKAKSVLNALGNWISIQVNALPKRQRVLVIDHQTYSHLADRYGIEQISMLDSYTTGGVLRPSSLRKITAAVKASGAKTIFSGFLPANKSLKRISRSAGLPIANTPLYGEGTAPGKTAVSTATLNICTYLKGQGGSCDQASADQLSQRWLTVR